MQWKISKKNFSREWAAKFQQYYHCQQRWDRLVEKLNIFFPFFKIYILILSNCQDVSSVAKTACALLLDWTTVYWGGEPMSLFQILKHILIWYIDDIEWVTTLSSKWVWYLGSKFFSSGFLGCSSYTTEDGLILAHFSFLM